MTKEFLALDVDGSGDISLKELDTLLRSMKRQLKMSELEIAKLVKNTDQNHDGIVGVKEFLTMVECGNKRDVIHKELIKRFGVRKAFEKYDKDGSGTLSREEFKKVVEDKYHTTLRSSQIGKMMDEVDKDNSGQIDYDEFLKSFSYFPVTGQI